VLSWRLVVAGPKPELRLLARERTGTAPEARKGERPAYFPELGGFRPTPVYDRYRLGPGAELAGPAIVEERESTVIVGPKARARVDEDLNLVLHLDQA
jgi:N-methylhydantoinase A